MEQTIPSNDHQPATMRDIRETNKRLDRQQEDLRELRRMQFQMLLGGFAFAGAVAIIAILMLPA